MSSFKRYLPFFIYPILYIPYYLLNTFVIVKIFGCGCPVVNQNGEIVNNFNANDFTYYFWLVIGLIAITITILNMIYDEEIENRILYFIVSITVILICFNIFSKTMQWK